MSLEVAAADVSDRVEAETGYSFDITMILGIFQVLMNLLQGCKKPIPPAPVPNPTTPQQKAWEAKCRANDAYDAGNADYSRPVLHRAATAMKHAKKKDGTPISRQEALALARATLDHARETDFDTLTEEVSQVSA